MASVTPTPIVALDVPDAQRALELVRQLGSACSFYKIGGELFTACGPSIVESVRAEGKEVFLDLKFHDIPNTVRAAARSAAHCGASLITVHALGGAAMIAAAVEGAGSKCGVLTVTVLTSLSGEDLSEAFGRHITSVADEVSRLARLAVSAGAHGVVCSGQEATRVRADYGDRLAILVPGVRLEGDSAGDQRRIVTPGAAARAGAQYVVLGRSVTAAASPLAVMHRVLAELGPELT